MKWILIILITITQFACSDKKETRKPSRGVIFAIAHIKEGKTVWAWTDQSIYIKEVNGSKVVFDTSYRYLLEGVDSSGKQTAKWIPIGKDSVKAYGIEGVPLDSLLKTFKPR